MATQAGLALGDEIEKRTGVGKKFVNESGLGNAVERAVKRANFVARGKFMVDASEQFPVSHVGRQQYQPGAAS